MLMTNVLVVGTRTISIRKSRFTTCSIKYIWVKEKRMKRKQKLRPGIVMKAVMLHGYSRTNVSVTLVH